MKMRHSFVIYINDNMFTTSTQLVIGQANHPKFTISTKYTLHFKNIALVELIQRTITITRLSLNFRKNGGAFISPELHVTFHLTADSRYGR